MNRQRVALTRKLRLGVGLAIAAGLSACAMETSSLPAPSGAMPCPSWAGDFQGRYSNAESPYLGCSNAANLRATLEDPADLQTGRTLAPATGAREAVAVRRHQSGQLPPLQQGSPAAPTIVFSGAGGGGAPR